METAYQRTAREQRERQEARAARLKAQRDVERRERHRGRPAWGSQEWAETRGDDLGESPDY